jgi:hypothetical protein
VDVGVMPFVRGEATRFVSPTKTPEYLAAGLPVVSTPVRDVVRGYGQRGLVEIAEDAEGFVAACERALATRDDPERRRKADAFLASMSWDATWAEMSRLVGEVVAARTAEREPVRTVE